MCCLLFMLFAMLVSVLLIGIRNERPYVLGLVVCGLRLGLVHVGLL